MRGLNSVRISRLAPTISAVTALIVLASLSDATATSRYAFQRLHYFCSGTQAAAARCSN